MLYYVLYGEFMYLSILRMTREHRGRTIFVYEKMFIKIGKIRVALRWHIFWRKRHTWTIGLFSKENNYSKIRVIKNINYPDLVYILYVLYNFSVYIIHFLILAPFRSYFELQIIVHQWTLFQVNPHTRWCSFLYPYKLF